MLRTCGVLAKLRKQEMTVLSKLWAKICEGMRDGWKPRKILRSSTFLRLKPPPPQESAADDARSAKIIHLLWYHAMRGWWWIVWTNSWSSCSTFKHHSLPNKQTATMLNHANIAFTPGMGIHTDDKASKQPHGKITKQTESQEIGQSTTGQHK